MNVAQMVVDHLGTVSAITALAGKRIYWDETPPPSSERPTIRVTLISGNRLHNLDYASPDVQVSAFAKNKEDVETLKEAIIDELRNRHGRMGSTWVTSVYQEDQTFRQDSWWHSPITFGLRLQEG
jgi:hypothetical protein